MPGHSQKILIIAFLIAAILALSSCATQKPKVEKARAEPEEPTESEISQPAPPQTTVKHGQELRLVRMMEGGACNLEDQGVRGLFLLYAEPGDIERIKKKKGAQVFAQFEHEIENLSLEALQASIEGINLGDNPFALDVEDAVDQSVEQLVARFKQSAEPLIGNFESNNGLTIDVVPFSPSIGFMLENCNKALTETPESE